MSYLKNYFSFIKPKLLHIWPLLYALLYIPWFNYLEKKYTSDYPGLHIIHVPIDDAIPFCEYFIIPYLLWFVFMIFSYTYMFHMKTSEFYRFCAYEIIGMTVFLIVCSLYPNGLNLRPDVDVDKNYFTLLVGRLYQTDTPTNVLPSMHVYCTISALAGIIKSSFLSEKTKGKKIFIAVISTLCLLICLSTMFLKQHSILDVIAAFALSAIVYVIVYHLIPKKDRL